MVKNIRPLHYFFVKTPLGHNIHWALMICSEQAARGGIRPHKIFSRKDRLQTQ